MILPIVTLTSLALPQIQGEAEPLLIKAEQIQLAPDQSLENSAILLRKGKVALVGDEIPADSEQRIQVLEFKGTVVAGFINGHSYLGQGKHLTEQLDAFTPELLASDAFDPFAKALLAAAQQGTTAVALAPMSSNIFAGQASVVQTGKIGRVVLESSYLKLALLTQAHDQNRYPTSRMGSADLIRKAFTQAQHEQTDFRLQFLAQALRNERKLVVHASKEGEIQSALKLCQEFELHPILMGCEEGHECLDQLAKSGAAVMLAPLNFSSSKKQLRLPAMLEQHNITFAFMAESAEQLRISAALAHRYGISKSTAMAALTSNPAQMLGVERSMGTLHRGKAANLCVFSGNPLDLSAKLLAVYIDGKAIDLDATSE